VLVLIVYCYNFNECWKSADGSFCKETKPCNSDSRAILHVFNNESLSTTTRL
jgi:hypothetical protein